MPETSLERIMRVRRATRGTYRNVGKFGSCERCGSLKLNGQCVSCGFARVCCYCGQTKQSDGSYSTIELKTLKNTTHGACPVCFKREKEKILELKNA